MSALTPKADIDRRLWNVRFVPIADMARRIRIDKKPRAFARGLIGHKTKLS